MSSDATLSQQILTLHELTRHFPSVYLRAWASIHLQAIIDERQWLRHVIVEYMESKFEFAGQAEPDDKLSEVWRVRQEKAKELASHTFFGVGLCFAQALPAIGFVLWVALAITLGCLIWRRIPQSFQLAPGLTVALSGISVGPYFLKKLWQALLLDGGWYTLALVLAHILVTVMWFLVGCLCLGALCLVFATWVGLQVVVVLAFTLISVYAFIILLRPKMRLAGAEHIL